MENKPRGRKLDFQDKLLLFKKKNRRQSTPQVIFLLLTLIVTYLAVQVITTFTASAQVPIKKDENATFTATMVGDMMFSRNVTKVLDRQGYDYLFRYVKPYFLNSDYNTGNFESPIILGNEEDYVLPDKNIYLHANQDAAPYLASINFSNVNVANNHLMDFGLAGLMETMDTFQNAGLPIIGAGLNKTQSGQITYNEFETMTVATLGGTDVGYQWGYSTDHQAGANRIRLADMLPLIREAAQNADLVVVHAHWGVEYDSSPTPRQEEIGRAMVDAGADIVIGHHSHTLQPVEIYNDGIILYSLGNFIFDQGWTKTKDSVLTQYKVMDNGDRILEMTPMQVAEASPTPLSGPLAGIHFQRMTQLLTKELTDDVNWTITDDQIIINLGPEQTR